MYKEKIVNIETNEVIFRDLTLEEISIIEAEKIEAELRVANAIQRTADKVALLTRLGITEDEAKLLLL